MDGKHFIRLRLEISVFKFIGISVVWTLISLPFSKVQSIGMTHNAIQISNRINAGIQASGVYAMIEIKVAILCS